MGDTGGAGSGPGGGSGTGPGRVMALLGAPFSRLAAPASVERCTCDWCSQFAPHISMSTPFGVTAGRWGYDAR